VQLTAFVDDWTYWIFRAHNFITGRPVQSAAMPLLFLLSGAKMGFLLCRGDTLPPINVKFGMGQRTIPNFTFIRAHMWEYSPQNCQHFEFWP